MVSLEDSWMLELFELHSDEGFCLDCYYMCEIVVVVDLVE